ncbi:uncharacterized protein [Panulirus ornatus]|uniref:uncharacterized protein n=1 Tax=Panulirus ornatus TaxID=150431 RepID=UPI003A85EDCF
MDDIMSRLKITQTAEDSTSEEISPSSDDESSREEEGTPYSEDKSSKEEDGTPNSEDESTRKEEGTSCSEQSATEEEGTPCSDDESTSDKEWTPCFDGKSPREEEGTPYSDDDSTSEEERTTCTDDESSREEEGMVYLNDGSSKEREETPCDDNESSREEEETPCSNESAREEGLPCYDDESTIEEERKPCCGYGEIKLPAGIKVNEENKNIYDDQNDNESTREDISALFTDTVRLTDNKEVKSREKDSVSIDRDTTKRKAIMGTTIKKEESSSEAAGHGKRMFDEFKPWTKEELHTLINRMKEQLPSANQCCINVLKKYDWQKVAFDYYSAEDCKRKMHHLMAKIRMLKTMTEILSELEEKLMEGQISDGLIFEDRQIFAKSFIEKNKERILPSKIFESCAEAWKKTPKKEKYKYIEEAIVARMNVIVPGCEKKRQVMTPFEVYYNYHCTVKAERNLNFRKEQMEKYKTLSVKEKYPYIYRSAVDLYNTVREAAVCNMGHSHWNDSIRGGPSKKESEILLRFLEMPWLPPVSALNLYFEENLKNGKYNDIDGPNRLFQALKEFGELPDHMRLAYKEKRIKMVAAYTKEFTSWWQSQNAVVHTLAEKFLGKRLVLSESEKKTLVTENLPVKEVMPVDVSLPLERESVFTRKKKVSGVAENEAPDIKEEKSSASVKRKVSADAKKKVTVCREKQSSAVKEKVSANAKNNVPFCKEKQSSVIVRKNVFTVDEKNVSVCKEKHSSSIVMEKISVNEEKEIPVSKEKSTACEEKEVFAVANEELSQVKEEDMCPDKKERFLPCSRIIEPFITKETIPSSAPDCFRTMFQKLSDIKPTLSLKSKIKHLKSWKSSYKRLNPTDRIVCKNFFEMLDIHISTMILTDVADLKKEERKTFLGKHRMFLRGVFRRDIFQECYPVK